MKILDETAYEYSNQNGSNFFQSRRTLGNTVKAKFNRFDDPSGLRALGKKYTAYSIIVDNDNNVIDYDKENFVDESDASAWLQVMKQSDFHTMRQGLIVDIEDQPTVEEQLINNINSGTPDESSEHEGALPDSWGNKDYSGPYWTESSSDKYHSLLMKLY